MNTPLVGLWRGGLIVIGWIPTLELPPNKWTNTVNCICALHHGQTFRFAWHPLLSLLLLGSKKNIPLPREVDSPIGFGRHGWGQLHGGVIKGWIKIICKQKRKGYLGSNQKEKLYIYIYILLQLGSPPSPHQPFF